MAEEEDENLPKAKKEKEKDPGLPDLAPGDVVNPIEYKMFDPANMQKTLAVPQRTVYSFQKELSSTLQKRLENIQIKLGSDDAHPITEKRVDAELVAGLQPWEEVDPTSGQLLELRALLAGPLKDSVVEGPVEVKPVRGAATPAAVTAKHVVAHQPHLHITPSILATMSGALPKAKVEDRNAMPPVNRRNAATPKLFEGILEAQERPEYGDYYDTIEKLDRQWKDAVGKRMSEFRPAEKGLDPSKAKDTTQRKKVSLGLQPEPATREKPEASVAPSSMPLNVALARQAHSPLVKKPQGPKKPPGMPAFLDGVVSYFTEVVSPDCNLESWLTPVNIQPVFKINDIPPDIENTIVTVARVTHSKFIDDQGIARHIRLALEKHHGYACKWHVIVGRKFGMQVNADRGNFLFMYIGHLGYVVFRTFG